MKRITLTAAGVCAVALLPAVAPSIAAANRTGSAVSIRVEGMSRTLLPETGLSPRSSEIDKDGKPTDTCVGDTAAVALEDGTHGHWTAGTYSSGLGYPVIGIEKESYPFTSDYYWSLWIDDKPATTGICGATLKAGDSVLFFPQCSQESAASCPQGLFDPAVLRVSGPSRAREGKNVKVKVSSLANLTGAPSPGAGVKLTFGKRSVKTNAAGVAQVRFAKAGKYKIVATAPNSIRAELTVQVSG